MDVDDDGKTSQKVLFDNLRAGRLSPSIPLSTISFFTFDDWTSLLAISFNLPLISPLVLFFGFFDGPAEQSSSFSVGMTGGMSGFLVSDNFFFFETSFPSSVLRFRFSEILVEIGIRMGISSSSPFSSSATFLRTFAIGKYDLMIF